MIVTEEIIEKLKKSHAENGDCKSCGWHNAFYEDENYLLEKIASDDFDISDIDGDAYLWIPCGAYDGEDHRGSKLYDWK